MADRNLIHDLTNSSPQSPVRSPGSDNEMLIEHNPAALDDDTDDSDDLDEAIGMVTQELVKKQPVSKKPKPIKKKPVDSVLSMRRLSQEHQPRAFLPPRINCPEKIILCLDLSSEMENTAFQMGDGSRQSPCALLRQALEIFVRSKLAMNSQHSIAVVFLLDSAQWELDFTSDPGHILDTLEELSQTSPSDNLDLASLFDIIAEKVEIPFVDHPDIIPPPYVVRAILVYGRSHCLPQYWGNRELPLELLQSEYFFLDIFYIHERPGPNNRCEWNTDKFIIKHGISGVSPTSQVANDGYQQLMSLVVREPKARSLLTNKDIFTMLCDLDLRGTAYVFEVTRNATRLHDGLAKLLAHPLQRTLQMDSAYTLSPDTDD